MAKLKRKPVSTLAKRLSYVDLIAPQHGRTSCSDTNLYNAAYGPDDFDGYGRCYRCTLLEAAKTMHDWTPDEDDE